MGLVAEAYAFERLYSVHIIVGALFLCAPIYVWEAIKDRRLLFSFNRYILGADMKNISHPLDKPLLRNALILSFSFVPLHFLIINTV